MYLFAAPSLNLVYERGDPSGWSEAAFHPLKDVAYVTRTHVDSLLIIDFGGPEIVDSMVPLTTLHGDPMSSITVSVSRDGSLLILSGATLVGRIGRLQLRDSQSLAILWEYYPGRSRAHLHPDGERVYFLEPWRDMGLIPGSVWELNLRTLLMRRILNSIDFRGPFPFYGLDVIDMDFTPDGKYGFFIGGELGFYYGPIIKYDFDEYRIVDTFYPPEGNARRILMYPLEIRNGG
jgi:hypothetical protein